MHTAQKCTKACKLLIYLKDLGAFLPNLAQVAQSWRAQMQYKRFTESQKIILRKILSTYPIFVHGLSDVVHPVGGLRWHISCMIFAS